MSNRKYVPVLVVREYFSQSRVAINGATFRRKLPKSWPGTASWALSEPKLLTTVIDPPEEAQIKLPALATVGP
jgi:hypothetical protein